MVIKETCQVIWQVLQPRYLKVPRKKEWKEIAAVFLSQWQFPNCVGAVDGKHVLIQAPPNSGSSYYNYIGQHSIVLLACCDANYIFTMVDIGNFGRISDCGVFSASAMGQAIIRDPEFLPPGEKLPNTNEAMPYVFLGDEAFPLKEHFLRPYPGRGLTEEKRIFNYRLSRARRWCIENAFGILSARWRVLRAPIQTHPETATIIVQACCCLHNFIMQCEQTGTNNMYCPSKFADDSQPNSTTVSGTWRDDSLNAGMLSLKSQGTNNYTFAAGNAREVFRRYFMNEGSVPWQSKSVNV